MSVHRLWVPTVDAPAMIRAVQTFEVSLKAAIFRKERLLLMQEADTGYWELPGGRIDIGEERIPHGDILAREITEELGAHFEIAPRAGMHTWVRHRPTDGRFILQAGRLADHVAGEPQISSEHMGFKWTTPGDWGTLIFPPDSDYRTALLTIWDMDRALRLR